MTYLHDDLQLFFFSFHGKLCVSDGHMCTYYVRRLPCMGTQQSGEEAWD